MRHLTPILKARIPFWSVLTIVLACIASAVGVSLYDNSQEHGVVQAAPVQQQCPIMNTEKAQQLTHGGKLYPLVNGSRCVFTDNGGNAWLSIVWLKDPQGKTFDMNARAINCEPVKLVDVNKSCWGAKHNGTYFLKDHKVVFVHASQAFTDNDLVDITNGVAASMTKTDQRPAQSV